MDERGIIIADRDADYCKEMADFFEKAGYSVETTDSAVHVLCSVLQKQTPVLLLGNDFDKKLSSADLVHLLKKCNRRLHVIMVSDEMPLAQLRQVRQEGIFYHALKPTVPGDTEEIGSAVESAFNAGRQAAVPQEQALPQGQEQMVSATVEPLPAQEPSTKKRLRQAAGWLLVMTLLIFGTSYLGLLAAETVQRGNSTAIWLFLAFCAVIILTQFLPIFRIKLPAPPVVVDPAKQRQDDSLKDR
jgi:DNA-binding NtrC family response regulator